MVNYDTHEGPAHGGSTIRARRAARKAFVQTRQGRARRCVDGNARGRGDHSQLSGPLCASSSPLTRPPGRRGGRHSCAR